MITSSMDQIDIKLELVAKREKDASKEYEEFEEHLRRFEEIDPQRPRKITVGVLYVRPGQKTAQEIFANGTIPTLTLTFTLSSTVILPSLFSRTLTLTPCPSSYPTLAHYPFPSLSHYLGLTLTLLYSDHDDSSVSYREFLKLLGSKVELSSYQGYVADFDTSDSPLPPF